MEAPRPLRRLRLFGQRLVRRWTPRSLYGRAVLIIILPVALMQVAVTWVFFQAHWDNVTSRLSDSLAGDIAAFVEAYETAPTPQTFGRLADRAERTMDLSMTLQPNQRLPEHRRAPFIVSPDHALADALSDRLARPFWFDTVKYPAYVDVRVQLPQGVLRVIAPRDRAVATQAGAFVLWIAGATALLTAVSVLFIRNQVRAIERLANAAEAFGRGEDLQGFRPQGAAEVRQAGHAFLDMRWRILRHIEQRTTLLASVSHDLRTPLTRLKLELELAEDDERTADMKRDLADMEHMIDEYLGFARGQAGEATQDVALKPLLVEAAEAAAPRSVSVEADPDLMAQLRPRAVKRAVGNLVANAAAHAQVVQVSAQTVGPSIEILVDDDGPGIAPEDYAEAFRPFARLDEARNQNKKGVGLGLAIARDVARSHGGDVTLEKSPLGRPEGGDAIAGVRRPRS